MKWFILPASVLIGLLLTICPLPEVLSILRPLWVLGILVYWQLQLPAKLLFGWALGLGLWLDLALGSVLGVRALGLIICLYCVIKLARQIGNYPIYQQSCFVGLLSLIYLAVIWSFDALLLHTFGPWTFLLPIWTTTLFWPVLLLIMSKFQQRGDYYG